MEKTNETEGYKRAQLRAESFPYLQWLKALTLSDMFFNTRVYEKGGRGRVGSRKSRENVEDGS